MLGVGAGAQDLLSTYMAYSLHCNGSPEVAHLFLPGLRPLCLPLHRPTTPHLTCRRYTTRFSLENLITVFSLIMGDMMPVGKKGYCKGAPHSQDPVFFQPWAMT